MIKKINNIKLTKFIKNLLNKKREVKCNFIKTKLKIINYKDINLLKNFVNEVGKIIPNRITGIKPKYQRKIKSAIKKARFLALLPYTDKHYL